MDVSVNLLIASLYRLSCFIPVAPVSMIEDASRSAAAVAAAFAADATKLLAAVAEQAAADTLHREEAAVAVLPIAAVGVARAVAVADVDSVAAVGVVTMVAAEVPEVAFVVAVHATGAFTMKGRRVTTMKIMPSVTSELSLLRMKLAPNIRRNFARNSITRESFMTIPTSISSIVRPTIRETAMPISRFTTSSISRRRCRCHHQAADSISISRWRRRRTTMDRCPRTSETIAREVGFVYFFVK